MTAHPDLSVVISVHNNEDTLVAALESILRQEDVALECIVVNDGSTDSSGALLDALAKRDARVRVVHQENHGLTRALIRGCSLARAPWIARQDADDVSLPGRLRAQLDRAKMPDAPALVGCGARGITAEGDVLRLIEPPADPDLARRQLLEQGQAISPHGSILFRRDSYERVGGYREVFYYAQDIDLTTRLAESGGVAAVTQVYYEFRVSVASISGRQSDRQLAYYRLIRAGARRRAAGLSEDDLLAEAVALRDRCWHGRRDGGSPFPATYNFGTCLMELNPLRAAHYFKLALGMRPWSAKAWVRLGQALLRARQQQEVS